MTEKKLYLVDAHALIYRAHFAFIKNPLINSKGQPTSAVFGFANYLVRLIEAYACPYLAVVMDSSKPTFRHEAYAQYKAHREEMPDELKAQMPLVRELIGALNLPVVIQDGFEADDLLAALTCKGLEQDFDVFLVTRDKDLMQLVGPRVKMLAPEGTGTLLLMGEQDVREKMGIGPEKIVDYLALLGDSSDNIPGVPGVGPKTALKMLEVAGSVDRMLEDPSVLVNPKLIQKIIENRERLEISKMLATLRVDCDVPLDLESLARQPVNREKCLAMFRDLEFSSLLRHPMFGGAPRLRPENQIATSLTEVAAFVESIRSVGYVAIDTHTTGLLARSAELVAIALAVEPTKALYIPVGHDQGDNLPLAAVMDILGPVIESSHIHKIGQNLKYDFQIFKNHTVCLRGISFDTMVAAYLIEPGKREYDLDVLAAQWLNLEITSFEKIIGKERPPRTFASVPLVEAGPYAAELVCMTLALKEKLEPILVERNSMELFSSIEIPLITVLADIEWHGMKIDTGLLKGLSHEYGAELERLSGEIFHMAGEELNLNSPKQIGEVLFDKLLLPQSKKTKNGAKSTSFEVLERLAPEYPIVQKILEYREVQKLVSTYIDALPGQVLASSGRVHSSLNQTIASTGRLSSTNPNLQNIPIRTDAGRRIREAFVADEGNVLVSADYSQIELRILAHLSDDPFLIAAFREDKDIHTQTASAIYQVFPELVTPEMRRAAKTINFGLMYGMGPINLARQLKISFAEAKSFIETYFRQFPTVHSYMETSIQKARELGYTETLLGRRRYLPEINASNRMVREAAERTAINTPVQGTAADIIKIAMVRIQREMGGACKDARMLLQVHDELVFEVPEAEAQEFKAWVTDIMCHAYEFKVPVRVDAGVAKNWSEAH